MDCQDFCPCLAGIFIIWLCQPRWQGEFRGKNPSVQNCMKAPDPCQTVTESPSRRDSVFRVYNRILMIENWSGTEVCCQRTVAPLGLKDSRFSPFSRGSRPWLLTFVPLGLEAQPVGTSPRDPPVDRDSMQTPLIGQQITTLHESQFPLFRYFAHNSQ